MPNEDKNFGGSLVLDFREWWRHMQAKNLTDFPKTCLLFAFPWIWPRGSESCRESPKRKKCLWLLSPDHWLKNEFAFFLGNKTTVYKQEIFIFKLQNGPKPMAPITRLLVDFVDILR